MSTQNDPFDDFATRLYGMGLPPITNREPRKDELDTLKEAESSLQVLKVQAENNEPQLNTAEHKRLLSLLKMRMGGRITEEQMWMAVGGE